MTEKKFVPNYYSKFKCIADKCKHSCCVGWEIDIDDLSLECYKTMDGSFGEKICNNIDFDCESPHFILKDDDRCPFLTENNLCEMICELGDESLCDICADHPRFRNFFSDCVEEGIGLCCEEAARIVLCEKDHFKLLPSGDFSCIYCDEEKELLLERQEVFDLLQNTEFSISERLMMLSQKYAFDVNDFYNKKLCDLFLWLERLDEKWTELLESISNYSCVNSVLDSERLSNAFENLSCYFVFRHFFDSMFDGRQQGRIKFAVAGCVLVALLCNSYLAEHGSISISEMAEFCRMFSSEVEYSEDNLDILFDNL